MIMASGDGLHTKITLKVTGPIANEIEMKKIMVKADELFGYSEDILNESQSQAQTDPNQTDLLKKKKKKK